MWQYARIDKKRAFLCSDFGYDYAVRTFGKVFVDSLPKFVKGKNKGKTKGSIEWARCVEGGFYKTGYNRGEGFVENRVGKIVSIVINVQGWGDHYPVYIALKGEGAYYKTSKDNPNIVHYVEYGKKPVDRVYGDPTEFINQQDFYHNKASWTLGEDQGDNDSDFYGYEDDERATPNMMQ